jgi:DNA repair protein RecO (recombination protein O)|tara:strand:+ start:4225 stop:4950 length:726 start_codon:yes stop_codon:yes gene_type:complete
VNEQQPAYVLHSRPWRETSVIADLFTLNQGRVSVIVHGARKAQGKQPAKRALVQPFTPLMVSFTGRGELRTSVQFEGAGAPLAIVGNSLYSGLYVNELLLNLLASDDPHPNLFAYYQALLNELMDNPLIEQCLRPFEVHLMDELGYHMVLDKDYISGQPVVADASYQLHPLQGVCVTQTPHDERDVPPSISGKVLLQLAAGYYADRQCLRVAKYMARANLDQLLDGKPIHSRNLFHTIVKK